MALLSRFRPVVSSTTLGRMAVVHIRFPDTWPLVAARHVRCVVGPHVVWATMSLACIVAPVVLMLWNGAGPEASMLSYAVSVSCVVASALLCATSLTDPGILLLRYDGVRGKWGRLGPPACVDGT